MRRTARRLGLHHPPGYLKDDVVRARVQAIWKQHPDCTAQQVIANLGLEHPLGVCRAYAHLKAVRMAAAKLSPTQKRIQWHIDRWTAIRIRIGKILKRNPKFIGRQVIERLRPEHRIRLQWVWHVMREYRRGSAKLSQRINRRHYLLKRARGKRTNG